MSDADFERIPPQSLDAEQATLGALLLGGDGIVRVVDMLSPHDFYREVHAHIYRACQRLYERGEPIDLTTVAHELRGQGHFESVGGFEYLDRLQRTTPFSINLERYAKIVKEQAQKRTALFAMQTLCGRCYNPEVTAAEVIEGLDKAVSDLQSDHGAEQSRLSGPALLQRVREAAASPRLRAISSGIPKLDWYLNGGFSTAKLYLLAGLTGLGKTALLAQTANHCISQGRRFGALIAEDEHWEFVSRLVALRTGISYPRLLRGKGNLVDPPWYGSDGEDLREAVFREQEYICNSGLLVLDYAPCTHPLRMKSTLRHMVRHDGCEMVGIDTINQVQGDGKSEYEQLLPSCKALNELIPELQVPFLVTAQLNGKDYRGDKEPCLADIKGLGKLSTDAKFVMLMWWRAGLGTQDAPRVDLLIPKNSCGNGVRAEKGDAVKLVGSERYSWDEVGADYRDTKRAAQDDDEIDPYHD